MGKHSPTTPQARRTARTRARVLRLYQAGQPVKVIAANVGIGNQYVLDLLHAGGIDVKADQRARKRVNRERFAATWNAAADLGDAAASLGVSETAACARAFVLRSRFGMRLKYMPSRWRPPAHVPAPLSDRVAVLLRKGLSNRVAMRRSGASHATVSNVRKRLGLLTVPRWTPEEDALFAKYSVTEVGKRTGRTMKCASARLRLLRRQGRA